MVFTEPSAFHLNIKPARRLLDGFFYLQWLCEENLRTFPDLDGFIRERVSSWGCSSVDEAARRYVDEYVKTLLPYDATLAGYSGVVRGLMDRSPYTVLYENGRIVGRNDGMNPGRPA